MPRNIRWDESVKENTLYLVEALLRHADDEFEDEELKTAVYIEWKTGNKLQVTGFEDKQISGKKKRIVEVGTKKEHLLKLLKKAGKILKIPKLKNEVSISLQDRELDEIQTALDCLKELGLREDEKSAKNKGYWKFTLTLKHQTGTKEENLDVIKRLWRKHSKTNSRETFQKNLEYEQLGTLKPPENIPRSGIAEFVGREEELERLHELLQQGSQVAISAIAGMGGVGKTELAIQYCLRHLQLHSYPGGICWLSARESDIGVQIIQFAITDLSLHLPEDLELQKRVRWCWQHWREENTLLVFDDVDNYGDIQPYLPPQASQFKVLITTRLKLDLASSLFLEVLSETNALLLLAQLIGEEKQNQELAQARELCQRLGYLPLALQLVGRYVKKRNISLAEMLRRLEEKGLSHPSLVVKENDPTRTLNVKYGVAAAFELSWSELSDDAQQLGCLLSLFALAPIPWSLVEHTAVEQDPEELEDARVELENLYLLQGEKSYQLHQLIHEFLRDKQSNLATASKQKSQFCQTMVEVAKEIPFSPTQKLISSVKDAIPHLVEVAQNLIDAVSDENLIWVFAGLDRFYSGQGLYLLAQPWCEQCVSLLQSRLVEEHPNIATSLHSLAHLYCNQGRYAEAEPLFQQSLELYKRRLGEEHPYVATSLYSLAYLYSYQGHYAKAELLYQQALSMRRRLLGEEHPDVATSLNNLALIYSDQGCYAEAEPLFQQALSMRRRLLGEEHPDVATSFNNLAYLYCKQGRYIEAEPLFQQSLELYQMLLGEEHPYVANSLDALAYLYSYQGNHAKAEPLFEQALKVYKQVLGEKHPDVITSLNNLGYFYSKQGHYAKAEALYEQALNMKKQLLGEEHPDVATCLNNLAYIYSKQKRYAEAEPLFQQALSMTKRLLGDKHPSIATSLSNLAELYCHQKYYAKAEFLYQQVLQIFEQQLGVSHHYTVTCRENLKSIRFAMIFVDFEETN